MFAHLVSASLLGSMAFGTTLGVSDYMPGLSRYASLSQNVVISAIDKINKGIGI